MNDAVNEENQVQEDTISELELNEMMKGIDPEILAKMTGQRQRDGFMEHLHEARTPQAMADILNAFAEFGGIPDFDIEGDASFNIHCHEGNLVVNHVTEVVIDKENLDNNIMLLGNFINDSAAQISHTASMRNPGASEEELDKIVASEQEELLKSIAQKTRHEMRAGAQNEKFSDAILGLMTVIAGDDYELLNRIFAKVDAAERHHDGHFLRLVGVLSGSALTHYDGEGGHTIYRNVESVDISSSINDDGQLHATIRFTNEISKIDIDEYKAFEFTHEEAMEKAYQAAQLGQTVSLFRCSKEDLFLDKLLLTGFSGPSVNYMLIEIVSKKEYVADVEFVASDFKESIEEYLSVVFRKSDGVMYSSCENPTPEENIGKKMSIKTESSTWHADGKMHQAFGLEARTVEPVTLDDSGVLFDVHIHGGTRTDEQGNNGYVLTHQPRLG